MILRIILLGCFLYSGMMFCQEKSTNLLQLEKQADSIYFNQTQYTTAKDFKKGLDIYNKLLDAVKDSTSQNFKKLLAKKFATQAIYLKQDLKLDSAIVYSKKSIKLQNNLKQQNLLLKGLVYKGLYEQWYALKQWDSALPIAREAEKTFKDTLGTNHKLVADVVYALGLIIGKDGDYSKVIEYYKKAIEININANGEFTPEVTIQEHNLALVYGFIGFYKKELESYKKVVKRWEAINDYKDMSYLSIAYSSLSVWYLQHGDVKTAEQYLLKQERLIKERKEDLNDWYNETFKGRTQTTLWSGKANLAWYNKDTLAAKDFNNKALDFIDKFDREDPDNNPHNLSYSNNFVDLVHMRSLRLKATILKNTNPEEAHRINEKILTLERDGEVPTVTLPEKHNILDYYIKTKKLSKAKEKLRLFRNLPRASDSDYVLMHLDAKQAYIALIEKDYNTLNRHYESVFKKLQRDTTHLIPIQNLKHKDCRPYGDGSILKIVQDAAKHYTQAFKNTSDKQYLLKAHNLNVLASEIFSENFSYSPFNESKYETATKINEQLLSTTLLLDDAIIMDKVLESIEQTGSKLSWKKFLASNQRENLNIPDSIIERENNLKSELHFYKKSAFADEETNEDKLKKYKEKIYDIEIEMERLEDWYRENYASYFNQTQNEFSVLKLKDQLKAKQLVIKYVIAEKDIYAFFMTKTTTELINLGNKEALYKKVSPFIASLSKTNSQDYRQLAKELYNVLLPINIDKKQLIFIQDDLLSFMPMEILLGANGKYLIQSHAVSYAPSLLLWDEQLKVKKSRQNKLGVFAPEYKKQRKKNPNRDNDAELLGAKTEARTIEKLFKADVFSGITATKDQFLNHAKKYNILHLAMHSTINNTAPEFSNLSFSDQEDGKLFISELYNMDLDADLAVLSACNTGAGSLEKGEGLINVSRAFTYAGVPSTVTSLWKVPDQETSQIMESFYKYLKSGKAKNEALQMAKLDYLKRTTDSELKHPYYWAGFVVSGNIEPIAGNTYIWRYALVILLVLCLAYRKRLVQLFK